MRSSIYILIISILFSCSVEQEKEELDGREILAKSITAHDPNNQWNELSLSIHIQEPRIGNPHRFSLLTLNNLNHSFELIRNRDSSLSKHTIDTNGISKVYLDGEEEIAPELVEKYRLKPERNSVYQSFYKMMCGLPMSLNGTAVSEFGTVSHHIYNHQDCYKIPIKLTEEVFSKDWIIYISKDKLEFTGAEIILPNDEIKGERLYFEGSISIEGVKIPRIRHWYELATEEYAGSDIIVKTL